MRILISLSLIIASLCANADSCRDVFSVKTFQSKYIDRATVGKYDNYAFLFPVSENAFQVMFQLSDQTYVSEFYSFDGEKITKLKDLPSHSFAGWPQYPTIHAPSRNVSNVNPKTEVSVFLNTFKRSFRRPGDILVTPRMLGQPGKPEFIEVTRGTFWAEDRPHQSAEFSNYVGALAVFPTRNLLAAAVVADPGKVVMINTETKQIINEVSILGYRPGLEIKNMQFSPNGEYLVLIDTFGVHAFKISAEGRKIDQLLLRDDESDMQLKNHTSPFDPYYHLLSSFSYSNDMLFSRDGNTLVLAKSTGGIKIVRLNKLEVGETLVPAQNLDD